MKTIEITAHQALAGLYYWFRQNPWFLDIDIKNSELTQAIAAQEALLLLSTNDVDAFQSLPVGAQGLALRLLLDFIARLDGLWRNRRWQIDADHPFALDTTHAPWLVIAQEIARLTPRSLLNH